VASIIILLVLIFTSNSYAEIPILLATFGVAALLNMGTNFLLGKISFISNSVGVILQLALAIDYAIILTHRFTEERELLPARDAAIAALTKAIPEISSSSLTTMAGLAALAFMKFGIGLDLAMVMIKAIMLSMLAVFTLMPGLLVITSNLMDKTTHRSFIPSVSILGRFSIKTGTLFHLFFL
ncbi:MAG: MMPL family transporter, partial [Tissierellia bacterium]|nr:MMPL family transporter [Tissierellia bacterium]